MIPMKITIAHIAQQAGVSRGTVDKVIHGRYGVKPEIRERVLQIIRSCGYVPPHAVLEPPHKTVAVLIPKSSNPYFSALQKGLNSLRAVLSGFTLSLPLLRG